MSHLLFPGFSSLLRCLGYPGIVTSPLRKTVFEGLTSSKVESRRDGFSNYMVDLDGHFIIIKHVPCHKCNQCGEVSYSGEVVVRIEEIVKKLKEALTEVAIVEYAA